MSDMTAKKRFSLNLSRSQKQFFSTFSGLFLVGLAFTILSPYFFSVNNLLTVATQTAVIAI
jgi:ribose/xylose/arabinose/galactoside ABC-type transport system permease subunit